MNSTTPESTDVPENPQSFGYGMGLSLGVLLLIIVITYASYSFTSMRLRAPSSSSSTTTTTDNDSIAAATEQGLDEATLRNYPKLLYAEAKLHNRDSSTAYGCSICLGDYKNSDMLRLLPDCGHLFHLRCIDPWLKFNPTCPICRSSPVPTPLVVTPMAVVVPIHDFNQD
ncbi:hypothetical protein CsSME_00027902 [Camellia sinensis var. sinensis]